LGGGGAVGTRDGMGATTGTGAGVAGAGVVGIGAGEVFGGVSFFGSGAGAVCVEEVAVGTSFATESVDDALGRTTTGTSTFVRPRRAKKKNPNMSPAVMPIYGVRRDIFKG
ncbi:MAG: hypothetical protein Q8P01_00740, partial [bacterium]|nr:hypothetical protein [bacterium]